MEKDLKKHRVQSWAGAYIDYSGIKEWIGQTYKFGDWWIDGSDFDGACGPIACSTDEQGNTMIAPAAAASHSPCGLRTFELTLFAVRSESCAEHPTTCTAVAPAWMLQPSMILVRAHVKGSCACEDSRFFQITRPDSQQTPTGCAQGTHNRQSAISEYVETHRAVDFTPAASHATGAPDNAATAASHCAAAQQKSPAGCVAEHDIEMDDVMVRPLEDDWDIDQDLSAAVAVTPPVWSPLNPARGFGATRFHASLQQYVLRLSNSNVLLAGKLLSECDRVEAFYQQHSNQWSRELMRLLNRANELMARHEPTGAADSTLLTHCHTTLDEPSSHPLFPTSARDIRIELESLKQALQRLYYAYVLLLSFVEQNSDGVRHLVYKVEKRSQQVLFFDFDAHLRQAYRFYAPVRGMHPINALLEFIEERYIVLNDGDKSGAARALHVDNPTHYPHTASDTATVGVLLGVSAALIAASFIVSDLIEPSSVSVETFSASPGSIGANIMAITGIVVLLGVAFGCNVVVWDHLHVNYEFIFQLDERSRWNGPRMLRYASKYAFVWSIGVFVYRRVDYRSNPWTVAVPYVTLGLLAVMLLIDSVAPLALALHWYQWAATAYSRLVKSKAAGAGPQKKSSKKKSKKAAAAQLWFGPSVVRIVCAPFFSVSFTDFYLTDQFTSLTGPLGQCQAVLCMMTGVVVTAPLLAMMPHVWRLLQCLRRWRDGPSWRLWHPNITNALKYLSGLAQIFASWRFSVAFKVVRDAHKASATLITSVSPVEVELAMWFVFAAIEYLFKIFWDLYMDVGMFVVGYDGEKYPLLRKRVLYPTPAYWAFAVVNTILRLTTLFRILMISQFPNSDAAHLNPVVFWVIEILRRFMWNFFRLDNEQCSNMEKYRAVDLLPPTFSSGEHDVMLEEMDKQFEALCGSSKTFAELPAKHALFRRLPLRHKRTALVALGLQQRDVDAAFASARRRHAAATNIASNIASNKENAAAMPSSHSAHNIWLLSEREANEMFKELHEEDKLRALFYAIGSETLASFLVRYPVRHATTEDGTPPLSSS